MILSKTITFEEVKAKADSLPVAEDHFDEPTVWYSSRTAWWTDDPNDLQPGGVPLDSLGAPLFQGDLKKFIAGVEGKPEHYGEFGLETFMAMHHKNFRPQTGEAARNFETYEYFEAAIRAKRLTQPDFQLTLKS